MKNNPTDIATQMKPLGKAQKSKRGSHSTIRFIADNFKFIQYGSMAFDVTTPPSFGLEETDRLCDKIARAVNLLEAHEAVAEAAKAYKFNGHDSECQCNRCGIKHALANLAKLKESQPK